MPTQSPIRSQIKTLDSHRRLRNWLTRNPSDPIAFSFRSRAKRRLHGAGSRELGSLCFLQMLTAFLQFIGKHYSATGQDQVTFFETNDLVSTGTKTGTQLQQPYRDIETSPQQNLHKGF